MILPTEVLHPGHRASTSVATNLVGGSGKKPGKLNGQMEVLHQPWHLLSRSPKSPLIQRSLPGMYLQQDVGLMVDSRLEVDKMVDQMKVPLIPAPSGAPDVWKGWVAGAIYLPTLLGR